MEFSSNQYCTVMTCKHNEQSYVLIGASFLLLQGLTLDFKRRRITTMMPSDQRFVSCRAAFLIHVRKSWEYFAMISKSALFGMYVEGFS